MAPKQRPPAVPLEREQTLRQALLEALRFGPLTAIELSAQVGVREKTVAQHLDHLARTLKHRDLALRVTPAQCTACGFTFEDRRRLTRPSRCPECRCQRIAPPAYEVVGEP